MACADAAMYNAKRAGGSTFALFDGRMQQGVSAQMDLLQALRDALELGQLHLHYQPKVNAVTGRMCGVEALLRWKHPSRGQVGPPGRRAWACSRRKTGMRSLMAAAPKSSISSWLLISSTNRRSYFFIFIFRLFHYFTYIFFCSFKKSCIIIFINIILF